MKKYLFIIILLLLCNGCSLIGKQKTPDNFQTGSKGEAPTAVYQKYDWIILSIEDYKWMKR